MTNIETPVFAPPPESDPTPPKAMEDVQAPGDGTEMELVVDGPFSVGREITIMRSATEDKPAYEDSGWEIVDSDKVIKNRATGQISTAVLVGKTIDGVPRVKLVSTDEVLQLNPEAVAEKEPLDAVEEEVADLAIEVSSGITDPSEMDIATKPNMREIREAAMRVNGDPSIQNPDGAVAGEAIPRAEAQVDTLEALKKGLSTDDLNRLRLYAESKQDERDIHKAARSGERVEPGASQYAAQSASGALKEMSAAARAVAGKYDVLYNK